MLFGAKAGVTALEKDKADGFVAAVCSSSITVFDNVDENIKWLPDHLAQLATGIKFKRRKLYTTNEAVEFHPQCFVALTSRTPKFIDGRDDVLDRTLVLWADRREKFLPESKGLQGISENRDALCTELLRYLNRIVAYLKEHNGRDEEVSFRMADFASFALTVARMEGQEEIAATILGKMDANRADLLLTEEPIAVCLEKWLERAENHWRKVGSAELQHELSRIALANGIRWPYQNPHSLGQRLSHITTDLRKWFKVEEDKSSSNTRSYRFAPKGTSPNHADSGLSAIQSAK
jgi:hypothetical protein